ncbi:uncharacterized protein EKO05_0008089 [Ascochyta rabiei]|uniref:uncharacterized protein n=1 Tax=Didymella rabiei TaxID=5454 RepID=UPI00220FCDB3|nr:uncharacterized protein EKO05_0008089 [Ascochyta rabiei]UPX17749.1 hypothetical protein EKO05_0008089 [Ascochyta rabiei]
MKSAEAGGFRASSPPLLLTSAPHVNSQFPHTTSVLHCFSTSLTSIVTVNKLTAQDGADNSRGLARIVNAEHSRTWRPGPDVEFPSRTYVSHTVCWSFDKKLPQEPHKWS